MTMRAGALQIPAISEGHWLLYSGRDHRAIGIRCPRCQEREIVYNGNYFCAGFDTEECRWALEHLDEPLEDPETGRWYDEPKNFWDLVDVIIPIGCAGGRRGSHW